MCAEKSLAPRILNPDESFVKNVVSFLSVKTTGDLVKRVFSAKLLNILG